ncbi:MAG: hypothetical protein LUG16_06690 [Candidatus Gastranaerophilales bacterium]|nr:hypothetical protein [Candidatus Gastranaerophilales bacterium]
MTDFLKILIHSNTLNFLIVLELIDFLYVKFNVNEKIQNLQAEIKNYVEESENEKLQAENDLKDIETALSVLPDKVVRIKNSAQRSIKSISEKISNDTENKKQDIANSAKRLFELETKKFKSKLVNLVAEKSVETSINNAKQALESDSSLHGKYIEDAIAEIDRINL